MFISQLIRYAPACSSYECFILKARRLSSKLLKQGYLMERFKPSFRKFYCGHGDLIQQYEVSLSRILNDILILDQQWLPNQSDFPPISWPWYRTWPSPIMSGFHGAFATGLACQQRTLFLPDTWFCLTIVRLACTSTVETRFLELAMSLLDFSPRIPLGTFSILLILVSVFDKGNDFGFPIVNFPWLSGDFPWIQSYGVHILSWLDKLGVVLAFSIAILKICKSLPNFWHRVTDITSFKNIWQVLQVIFCPSQVKYRFKNMFLKEFLTHSSTLI